MLLDDDEAKLVCHADEFAYRDLAATYTFANDLTTALAIQEVTEALNAELQEMVADMDWVFSYNPLPAIATQQGASRGGDQLGLDRDVRDLIGRPTPFPTSHFPISHRTC